MGFASDKAYLNSHLLTDHHNFLCRRQRDREEASVARIVTSYRLRTYVTCGLRIRFGPFRVPAPPMPPLSRLLK